MVPKPLNRSQLKGGPLRPWYPHCPLCGNFSLSPFCPTCAAGLKGLKPQWDRERHLFYFADYSDLEVVFKLKYYRWGGRWFRELGRLLLGQFPKIELDRPIFAIPIDPVPRVERGFSHTALLARGLPYRPVWGLRAKNRVHYSGQPLEFRRANPRNFQYRGPTNCYGILVDDISTTGLTLQEARGKLEEEGVEVLFSIVIGKGG
jgi:competence protein ComFC